MTARVGFSASDTEQQTPDSAVNYLNRALLLLADRFNLGESLERDPAAFAVQFAPLLSALIETQAREYQSRVFSDRMKSLEFALEKQLADLIGTLPTFESLLADLPELVGYWEEMKAETGCACARKDGVAYRQGFNDGRRAGKNGR